MVRIGRQIPHFSGVDPSSVEAVFSEDRRFRYLLKMEFGGTLYDSGRTGSAAVVLKNPSAADERAADSTIRKVETFIYHRLGDVSRLSILNIFALRATDAADLEREFREKGAEAVVGPENDAVIRECCSEADYVVAAWGNRSGIDRVLYEERVRAVREILGGSGMHRVFEVKGDRVTDHPLHGMMWGYDHQLVPFQGFNRE